MLSFEYAAQLEVSHLLMEIDKHLNTPFEPTILLIPSMSNIISSLTFGKRFEYDDPDRIMLDNLIMVILFELILQLIKIDYHMRIVQLITN